MREQQGDKKGVADVSENIAVAYYDSGKYETAINYYEKSLIIREKLNDKKGVVAVMNDLASVNENTFRYDKAIDYYQKSLNVSEKLGDKETNVKILNKIANVYYENKQLDKSIEFYEKSVQTGKAIGNDKKVAESLNNIGVLYSDMGDLDKAEKYLKQSMNYYDKTNDKMSKSLSLNNLGNVNFEYKNLDKALDYYQQSLKIKEELKYFLGVATSLHNIGAVQFEMNDLKKAVEYFNKSNKIAIDLNDKKLQSKNYKYLTDVCIKKKDYKGAYECYLNYANSNFVFDDESKLANEMFTDDNQLSEASQIKNLKTEIQKQKVLAQFEASKNILQLNLKNLEIEKGKQEISKQRQLLISALVGFLIILSFSIMLFRLYIQKKKANVLLAVKNEEILQQKEEIEAQRDEIEVQRDYVVKQRDKIAFQKQEITDSIVYAGLIQSAILPPTPYLHELLNNFFVYYKPRDIVSGDFYWTTKKEDKTIVVVGDCTGHGVPGAFMSMLGISSLNEIVNKTPELDAASILNQLRDHIVDALHQKGDNNSRDGMDISISVFDNDFTNLQFAGAYNPVYIIRKVDNNTLEENLLLQENCTAFKNEYNLFEIKADKMPVSIYDNMSPFVNNEFTLQKDDTIYMFSDGYSDQFGGQEEKKFKAKPFKNMLLELQKQSMENQMDSINKAHLDWKGNLAQIDDILVVGIKV
jgi:tetratricopeptide (TPR) repeat protein